MEHRSRDGTVRFLLQAPNCGGRELDAQRRTDGAAPAVASDLAASLIWSTLALLGRTAPRPPAVLSTLRMSPGRAA